MSTIKITRCDICHEIIPDIDPRGKIDMFFLKERFTWPDVHIKCLQKVYNDIVVQMHPGCNHMITAK